MGRVSDLLYDLWNGWIETLSGWLACWKGWGRKPSGKEPSKEQDKKAKEEQNEIMQKGISSSIYAAATSSISRVASVMRSGKEVFLADVERGGLRSNNVRRSVSRGSRESQGR